MSSVTEWFRKKCHFVTAAAKTGMDFAYRSNYEMYTSLKDNHESYERSKNNNRIYKLVQLAKFMSCVMITIQHSLFFIILDKERKT